MAKAKINAGWLPWLMATLLSTLVVGCGGGGGGGSSSTALSGIAPTVTTVAPLTNASNIPINTKTITAAFTKAMDPATLTTESFTLACPTGATVAGTVSYLATGNTATLTLPVAFTLPANTLCTATITTAAKDSTGLALASNFVWTFTTGAAADTIAPTVSGTINANGAIGVAINTKSGATFSEAMDPATISAATFTLKQGVTAVPGAVTYSGVTAIFTPASNLAPNTVYTATITTGAKDLAGNPLANDYVWSWTTGATLDTTAPTVTGTINANNATNVAINTKVGATFSEAMDPLTITTQNFTLKADGSTTAVAGTVIYSGVSAVFSPLSNLAYATRYSVTVKGGANGVKDLAGNPLASDYVISWTTGSAPDTTRPTVIGTIHANGATNVAINTNVGATFSEGMDPLTITNQSISLKETVSATAIVGTVSYAGVNALFKPSSNLTPSTQYTVTIKSGGNGVKDLAGNALASDYVISWTTAATADTTPPTVTLVSPANLATGVALNSAVNATFSEALDVLTINNVSFTVAGVTGTVAYDALNKTATFTPSSNLAASTTYTATIATTVTDLAGNPLASSKVWSFTTGTGLAPGAIALGSAATFGIMATSAITNTGFSTINGDVSLDPGTSMTGFPPGVVNGSIHVNDTASAQARADLLVTYNAAKTLAPGTTISGGADLGALYPGGIPPGTYTSGSTMLVSTPLVLDAGGNANAVWVFQIGSSLTTGANITLANGAQAKNVFWVPSLDATIGVGTTFNGTIVSGRDVTGVTGATINGRILAGAVLAGTIALDTNTINVPAP